jgi:hypothetical protein
VVLTSPDPSVYSGNDGLLLGTSTHDSHARMDEWRRDDPQSDLWRDGDSFFTKLGAELAIVVDQPQVTYSQCASLPATAWTERISFSNLHANTQLCMHTAMGRYARIRIRALPDAIIDTANIAGVTWNPP